MLCYFKNGVLQKGPLLVHDHANKLVRIRSKNTKVSGTSFYLTAEIEVNGKGTTQFYVNG